MQIKSTKSEIRNKSKGPKKEAQNGENGALGALGYTSGRSCRCVVYEEIRGALRPLPVEALEPRALLATVPPGFVDSLFAGGLTNPVAMDFAPDGRLFVVEQGGGVRVVRDGQTVVEPFARVDAAAGGERGALGVALDPAFATNGYVYVYYTAREPQAHNRVSRFTAGDADPDPAAYRPGDVAVPGSEFAVIDLDPLTEATNHNGGAIHFGPDGKLYVATGDNARSDTAQSLNTTLGKVLRLNGDGSVPADNPFLDRTTGTSRAIWAYGLRNPFTFAFERTTGRMFINDVGSGFWEEVNEGAAGANYGWPGTEGPTGNPRFTPPVFAYPHDPERGSPAGCAIAAGAFYDPPAGAPAPFPAGYAGDYFFADYCENWIWRLDRETGQASEFAAGYDVPVFGLRTGSDGALYYLAWHTGEVRRIDFDASGGPVIVTPPAPQTVLAGRPVTFVVEAAGGEPLSYQWQRDGTDIPGATGPAYTIPAVGAADDGATFRAVVTNPTGSATSPPATLEVAGGGAPEPVILTPRAGRPYRAGQALRFAGRARDPEDGNLPPSAFSWRVDFHHDEHTHPFVSESRGRRSGSARIPREGETSANVWYRVHLTVTDSSGVSTSTFRDVRPLTAAVTVGASTPGLAVLLDGQPLTAPFTFTGVAGLRRRLEAPATQELNGVTYAFRGWGRRRSAVMEVVTPARDRTYTAVYEPLEGGAGA